MKHYQGEPQRIDIFREEYGFLSNFHPVPVFFDGVLYADNEAAYQAQKCEKPEERLAFAQLSADEAKRMGRKAALRSDWEDVKIPLMKAIVRAKFEQHPDLAARLMETGSKPLFEGNYWRDLFWGVDMRTGEGRNELGRILMALREEIGISGIADRSELIPERSLGPVRGMSVKYIDIANADCDVIVNAANCDMIGGGGVDGAIHGAAGYGLYEECRKIGRIEHGELRVTKGYRLKATHIIHVVGPIYQKHDNGMLADCYRKALDTALSLGAKRIAFPLISAGKFCFPKELAAHIAVTTVCGWLAGHEDAQLQVEFDCLDNRCFELLCHELKAIS